MERHAVLYDSDCGFCRACTALLLAWDREGHLRPVRIQSEEVDELLPTMSHEERMASWHLVTPRGTTYSAGAAFPPVLRLLPGGGPLASLAERFPAAVERGYRFVANRRSLVGRMLPRTTREWADARIRSREAEAGVRRATAGATG